MTLVWRSVVCPGWTHVLPAMMTRDRNQHWIWITENIQWMIKSSFNCKLGWFSAWQQQTGKPGWFQCELLHHPGDSPNALYISLCLYVYMCICVYVFSAGGPTGSRPVLLWHFIHKNLLVKWGSMWFQHCRCPWQQTPRSLGGAAPASRWWSTVEGRRRIVRGRHNIEEGQETRSRKHLLK